MAASAPGEGMSSLYVHVVRGNFFDAKYGTIRGGSKPDVYESAHSHAATRPLLAPADADFLCRHCYSDTVWSRVQDDARVMQRQLKAMSQPFARVSVEHGQRVVFSPLSSPGRRALVHEQRFSFDRTVVVASIITRKHEAEYEIGRGAYGALVLAFLLRAWEHCGSDNRTLNVSTNEGRSAFEYAHVMEMYRLVRWPAYAQDFTLVRHEGFRTFYDTLPSDSLARNLASFAASEECATAQELSGLRVDMSVQTRSIVHQAQHMHVLGRTASEGIAYVLSELQELLKVPAEQCAEERRACFAVRYVQTQELLKQMMSDSDALVHAAVAAADRVRDGNAIQADRSLARSDNVDKFRTPVVHGTGCV